ncbi:glycerophosphodiester phosphodiesterase family protein [Nocardiopsis sediminis]|uniref:Glycerophosphodiester phosphodiesterase family protein n=1 Tax=Nocardiopsis sediminis TaxID=1778267 RepID=A0ABV8FSE4_9ACTN
MSPRESAPARRRRRFRKRCAAGTALLCTAAFMWINNTDLLADHSVEEHGVLAHRGLGQTFGHEGVGNDTCTAERIDEPEHDFLENTVPGMRAAFDAGADQVEFDVHMTADEEFAVFHDWELDCRTDLSGTTRDHTLAELQQADIGYGYTADGGETHPFRGAGKGLMPSLDEVLAEFPDDDLLLHVKSDDPAEGELLAGRLAELPDERLADLTVYGGDGPIAALRERLPELRVMSKAMMTDCLVAYEAVGWTGHVPPSCSRMQLHVPEGYGPWLWGWPARFTQCMAAADTRVVIVAGSGGFSEGFDDIGSLERIPDGFTGLVWTNRADETAAAIHGPNG